MPAVAASPAAKSAANGSPGKKMTSAPTPKPAEMLPSTESPTVEAAPSIASAM